MKLKDKVKNLIKVYEVVIADQENLMDDGGTLEQGTYNEMEAELDCYMIFKRALEKLLEDEKEPESYLGHNV